MSTFEHVDAILKALDVEHELLRLKLEQLDLDKQKYLAGEMSAEEIAEKWVTREDAK